MRVPERYGDPRGCNGELALHETRGEERGGTTPGEPRILALWPWGPHAIFALEFTIFGRQIPINSRASKWIGFELIRRSDDGRRQYG